jgi:hypothetical protein
MALLLVARRGDPVKIEGVRTWPTRTPTATGTVPCCPARRPTLAGPTFEEWLDSTS